MRPAPDDGCSSGDFKVDGVCGDASLYVRWHPARAAPDRRAGCTSLAFGSLDDMTPGALPSRKPPCSLFRPNFMEKDTCKTVFAGAVLGAKLFHYSRSRGSVINISAKLLQ